MKSKPKIVVGLLAFMVIGIGLYIYRLDEKKKEIVSQVKLTPEQIFKEVSAIEGFHSKLDYFRIFGQDRVEFKLAANPETIFAYRFQGGWISRGGTGEGIQNCSVYADFAEQYRPACYDSATKKNKYIDSKGESINYPPSQMVSYISE